MNKIQVSTFRWVPPPLQGLVRDLRVRWALEEAGLPYEELLIGEEEQNSSAYRALQPFGQVPAYIDGEGTLFESAAIVLKIAERCEALLPSEAQERARTHTWMFAALNSVEPHLLRLTELDFFHSGESWAEQARPHWLERARRCLKDLSDVLQGRDYLEDRFTAGDLLMTAVLRIPRHIPLVAEYPVLSAYMERCQSRPAFQRALQSQMACYERNAPQLAS